MGTKAPFVEPKIELHDFGVPAYRIRRTSAISHRFICTCIPPLNAAKPVAVFKDAFHSEEEAAGVCDYGVLWKRSTSAWAVTKRSLHGCTARIVAGTASI